MSILPGCSPSAEQTIVMTVAGKVTPYLRLVRFPNLFTAMADIMAGYFVVLGFPSAPWDLFFLMLASACIYGGGCALNDLCDLEVDRLERPSRPIPSGAISRRVALIASIILFVAGWGLTILVGSLTFWVAGLLIGLVVSYDSATKNYPVLGSFNMAACRGLNLVLGMAAGGFSWYWLIFPAITMGYVFWLTVLSNYEAGGTPGRYRVAAPSGILVVLLIPVWLVAKGDLGAQAFIALTALLLMTAPRLLQWIGQPTPFHTGQAVKSLILAIPLLDAVYVMGTQHWSLAIPLLLCVFLAVSAARFMYVT